MVSFFLSICLASVRLERNNLAKTNPKSRPRIERITNSYPKDYSNVEYFNHPLTSLGEEYREQRDCDLNNTVANPSTIQINGKDVHVGLACEVNNYMEYVVAYTPLSENPDVVYVSLIQAIIVAVVIVGVFLVLAISYCCCK